jgi:dual oxidase
MGIGRVQHRPRRHRRHHHHDDHNHDHDGKGETIHENEDHDHEHLFQRILHHDSPYAYLGPTPNLWKFFLDGDRNTTGSIVLTSVFVLIASSIFHKLWRKWWFEGWLVSHITGALLVLIAGILHGADDVFVVVIIWWGLDLLIRYGVMAAWRYPQQATITRVADSVTKIQFDKPLNNFHHEAGQFLQVAIPSVRLSEFHPFSIATAPTDPFVTLYIRALPENKQWTRQLYDRAAAPQDDENKTSSAHQSAQIWMEGPYGSIPHIISNANQYSVAILVSGGIGVTPCHGIARALVSHSPLLIYKRFGTFGRSRTSA